MTKGIMRHLKSNFFPYLIVLSLLLSVGASFYRFIVRNDYLVYYESACDPYTESCFQNCEEDAPCTYYKQIRKYAPDIYNQCGKDITNCELANTCLLDEHDCSVTYCSPGTGDTCEDISGSTSINNTKDIQ